MRDLTAVIGCFTLPAPALVNISCCVSTLQANRFGQRVDRGSLGPPVISIGPLVIPLASAALSLGSPWISFGPFAILFGLPTIPLGPSVFGLGLLGFLPVVDLCVVEREKGKAPALPILGRCISYPSCVWLLVKITSGSGRGLGRDLDRFVPWSFRSRVSASSMSESMSSILFIGGCSGSVHDIAFP